MDNYSFYKSLYDRELNRRGHLESAISFPVTALTIIVASNSYLLKDLNKDCEGLFELSIKYLIAGILMTLLIIALYYILKSSNNLFKGFAYRNFSYVTDILKYQLEIEKYNKLNEESLKINFETVIISELVELTDDHLIFNDKRSKDIHKAKTFLIVSLIPTSINFLISLFNYIKT